jgi:transcriptional regulator with XRE-family HTH domain
MKLGNKLRRLRKLRGLTIEELADQSEITKGFISQLERDLAVPSVITLKQILDVFGVELSSFFSDMSVKEKNLFTRTDRTLHSVTEDYKLENLIPKLKYLEMEPLLLTVQPDAKYDMQFGEDEGFGFILRGKLDVTIGNETKSMNRGDCFYIFFENPLCLQNSSNKVAEILMVNY